MKLNVPFYVQATQLDCGPTALKMAFEFLGKPVDIVRIKDAANIKADKGVSTIRLAVAGAALGFRTSFFSKTLSFNPSHQELSFYQQYGDINEDETQKLVREARNAGALLEERQLSLSEVLSHVTTSSIPIVLLDWSKITGKGTYQGHFVPVVGFDETHVFVHNQGQTAPMPFLSIPREQFEQARTAAGTDEDIIIISLPQSF